MLFYALAILSLCATSLAGHHKAHNGKRAETSAPAPTGSSSSKNGELAGVLSAYLEGHSVGQMLSAPSITLGLASQVPVTMMAQMMTEIPGSIWIDLMNSQKRSSIAAQFAEGNTPAWYQGLPDNLQQYFQKMNNGIKNGDAVATVHETTNPLTVDPTPTSTAASETAQASQTTQAASSTSSAGANMPTALDGGVMGAVAGAAGVLGVALAL